MSMYGQPTNYAQPQMSLEIPACLVGEEQKSFRNARNIIKTIPAASGSGAGPSTTMLFSIPSGGNSFLKPGSMYLRAKISIAITGTTGVSWKFAGNSASNISGSDIYDWGGASSLIDRINCSFSGTTMSYPNYAHYKNSVLSHVFTNGYIFNDLRQCESAGVTRLATTNTSASKDVYVSIPLFIGCFNSMTAFPLCLLQSPVQVEILTAAVNAAFAGAVNGVTNYTISEASLVYESIEVEPSFVQALRSSKAGQSFNFKVNDYLSVGAWAPSNSERFTISAGLSSLKSILYTEQPQSCVASSIAEKYYSSNGLSFANFYVDGQQVSVNNLTDDSVAYLEMNRALQKITDPTQTSYMQSFDNTDTTNLRTGYTLSNFLLGTSTMLVSDYGFSSQGIPASTVQIELNHSATSDQAVRWQNATAFANSNAYAWLLYDAIYSISIDTGMLQIRK